MTTEEAFQVIDHCVKMGIYAYYIVEEGSPVTVHGIGMMECYEDELISGTNREFFVFDDAMRYMAKLIDKGCFYQYPDNRSLQANSMYRIEPIDQIGIVEHNTTTSER